jgi:hypothetical protein
MYREARVTLARKQESDVLTWMRHMGKRLSAIALVALFMRALLPAGYMLAEADTGGARYVTLQICDGHASAQKLLNLDTGEEVLLSALPKKAKDDGAKTPCVFSAAPAIVEPLVVVEPVEFLVDTDVIFSPAQDIRPGRGIAAPPPPSTGPPSLI